MVLEESRPRVQLVGGAFDGKLSELPQPLPQLLKLENPQERPGKVSYYRLVQTQTGPVYMEWGPTRHLQPVRSELRRVPGPPRSFR